MRSINAILNTTSPTGSVAEGTQTPALWHDGATHTGPTGMETQVAGLGDIDVSGVGGMGEDEDIVRGEVPVPVTTATGDEIWGMEVDSEGRLMRFSYFCTR